MLRLILLYALTLVVLSGCTPEQAARDRAKIIVSGSGSIEPVMVALAKRFESTRPGTQILVERGGTKRGLTALLEGKAHIAMVARPLSSKEALFAYPLARDGIGFIVHDSNPVTTLSATQVKRIYRGEASNWRQVGGGNRPIVAIIRESGRGSMDMFMDYFSLRAADIRFESEASNSDATLHLVAQDPNAISFVSVGEAERAIQTGKPIKLLRFDGVIASSANVRNGIYPLQRPLLLVTQDPPQGVIKDFIDFCLSAASADVILRHNYVPFLE
jgi:phosphate transport system substrate-binding protein